MAAVNTVFKKTFIQKIPYQFRCEHCGQGSGLRTAVITGTAQHKKGGYNATLKDKEQDRLISNALENLKNNVNKTRLDVEGAQLYDEEKFNSLCPHCGKYQSWGSNHTAQFLFRKFFSSILCGGFCGVPIFVLAAVVLDSIVEDPYTPALIVGGVAAVVLAIFFFVKTVKKRIQVYKDGKSVAEKRLPVIYWDNSTAEDGGAIMVEKA